MSKLMIFHDTIVLQYTIVIPSFSRRFQSSCLGSKLTNLAHHPHALQHGAEAHVVIREGSLLPRQAMSDD